MRVTPSVRFRTKGGRDGLRRLAGVWKEQKPTLKERASMFVWNKLFRFKPRRWSWRHTLLVTERKRCSC